MKVLRILMLTLAATLLALGLWGCGSSGSGTPAVVDRDGDGIPNVDDAFPDDSARFAAFESDLDFDTFSVIVAMAENGAGVVGGQTDAETPNTLKAVRVTINLETGDAEDVLLAPLGGINANQGRVSSAVYGLNADGLAVGESSLLEGGMLFFVPVYWPADETVPTRLSLDVIFEGEETPIAYTDGAAYGVNIHGQIVGEVSMSGGSPLAVVWLPTEDGYGDPIALSSLMDMGASTAHFINPDGIIVGEAEGEGGLRAVLWTVDAEGEVGSVVDLGVLEGHVISGAYGVDALGRIVGESVSEDGVVHGVLWRGHTDEAESLGENSSAMAISAANNRIVGSAMVDGEMRAAVWDTRSTVLTNSDAVLTEGPTFTPLAGNSRAYAQSQGEIGAVGGLYVDHAFIAIPVMP
ncbi:hypothetical protein [Geoalkalibacter halelectricus]|uniref:hypothetical protein n=1 Tax=Geoalkalibacter halelectricus TaxID=2847045 RepID=UPI003D1A322B